MIDITEQMITMSRKVQAFGGRCYAAFPQKVNQGGKPFMVLGCVGHDPGLVLDGEEINADLTYQADVYSPSQSDLRANVGHLTDIYARLHIRQIGMSQDYDPNYNQYHGMVTYMVKVDKRGVTYTE